MLELTVNHGDHIRYLHEAAVALEAQGLIHVCSECSEQTPSATRVYHVTSEALVCTICRWPFAMTPGFDVIGFRCPRCVAAQGSPVHGFLGPLH